MDKNNRYGLTVCACCLGYLLQAVVVNVSPLLFITLKEQFMLTYSQLGLLVLTNFVAQFCCDLFFGSILDRCRFRTLAKASAVIAGLGLILFATAPILLPENPYPGFLAATLLFAGSGGLLEVLLSPIINAIPLPQEKKAPLLSFVHAAYSWGQVVVVLFTTAFLFFFGTKVWQWIMLFWCLPAASVFVLFIKAPLAEGVPQEKQQSLKSILKNPAFLLFMILMLSGGAGELIISQWASSFLEKGLSIPKAVGDIAGVCTFAAAMGIGRLAYGKFGAKINIKKIMTIGLLILFGCYLCSALAPGSIIPLLAIFISGFGVSLIWPGTLSLAAETFPLAGSWIFALLAAGGDMGASFGPWLCGKLIDVSAKIPFVQTIATTANLSIEQVSLRVGMLSGAIFPLVGLLALFIINRRKIKK